MDFSDEIVCCDVHVVSYDPFEVCWPALVYCTVVSPSQSQKFPIAQILWVVLIFHHAQGASRCDVCVGMNWIGSSICGVVLE
jgi:hypothetical protein